jgi:hypothetical protein
MGWREMTAADIGLYPAIRRRTRLSSHHREMVREDFMYRYWQSADYVQGPDGRFEGRSAGGYRWGGMPFMYPVSFGHVTAWV